MYLLYLNKLKYLFDQCKTIEVNFDKYKVMQDDKNPNLFAVTFEQDWHTIYNNNGYYNDFGYVCLIWDFSGENPVVTFRSWQHKDTPPTQRTTIDNYREKKSIQ